MRTITVELTLDEADLLICSLLTRRGNILRANNLRMQAADEVESAALKALYKRLTAIPEVREQLYAQEHQ